MNLLQLAQTTSSNADAGGSMFLSIMYLIVAVAFLAGLWKTFNKAKKPGWGAIIPIYNTYLILKVAGRSGWWLLLYLIPIVNIITHLVVSLDVAKGFKKSALFGVLGLWLFPMIGFIIIGFGDAKYAGAPKH